MKIKITKNNIIIILFLFASKPVFSQFTKKDVKTFFTDIKKERNTASFLEKKKFKETRIAIVDIEDKGKTLIAFNVLKYDTDIFFKVKYNKQDFEFADKKIEYENIFTFSTGGKIDSIYYDYYIVLKGKN